YEHGPASENLRSERDDLHELLGAQLAGDRPEDARSDRLVLLRDEHRGVAVELDVAAIRTRQLALGADDDRARDLALFHLRTRNRFADRHDDDVTDARVAAARTAQHLDAVHLLGAAVVGDIEDGRHLDHGYLPPMSASPASPGVDGCSGLVGSSALWLI